MVGASIRGTKKISTWGLWIMLGGDDSMNPFCINSACGAHQVVAYVLFNHLSQLNFIGTLRQQSKQKGNRRHGNTNSNNLLQGPHVQTPRQTWVPGRRPHGQEGPEPNHYHRSGPRWRAWAGGKREGTRRPGLRSQSLPDARWVRPLKQTHVA